MNVGGTVQTAPVARPVLCLVSSDVVAASARRSRVAATRPGVPSDPADPWHMAVTMWAGTLELSAGERANYIKRVGWLAGDHPDQSPWALTTRSLAAWLNRQSTWSLSTRRKVIVAVRAFYAWGVRAGLVAVSPLAGVSVTPPARPGPLRAAVPVSWAVPLEDFLTWQRASAKAESTLRTRREHLCQLAALHGDPWAVTEGDLGRWLSCEDWAPTTKRAKRSTVRSFYSWAVRAGHLANSPAADLDPVRQRRALPRPAPRDVVLAALEAATDDRVRLAIGLGTYAGLRRAEIAQLHTRDILEDTLRVRGKGGHERLVPIHGELAGMLQVFAPVDGWLFPARDPDQHLTPRWLGRMVSSSLGAGWTTHTLRHLFATSAYASQRDLRAVQELLGHSKPETTARYAAVPDGALREAVAGVSLSTWR